LNIQNGVLKALSSAFERIWATGKDCIYATVPLLKNVLVDCIAVHY
jgi:hypothetical protein